MQFHDTADRYALNGARRGRDALPGRPRRRRPAVTLRDVGSSRRPGRHLHLRPRALDRLHPPGQPVLAGQERDGLSDPNAVPIRSDDLFFGAKTGDVSPTGSPRPGRDPEADEQQRLLANLITADVGRPRASAALLVPAQRPEGRRRATLRLRQRQRPGDPERDEGPVQPLPVRQRAGLLGGRLGVHPLDLLHLPRHADQRRRRWPATRPQGFEIALHLWVSGTTDGSANPGDKNCFTSSPPGPRGRLALPHAHSSALPERGDGAHPRAPCSLADPGQQRRPHLPNIDGSTLAGDPAARSPGLLHRVWVPAELRLPTGGSRRLAGGARSRRVRSESPRSPAFHGTHRCRAATRGSQRTALRRQPDIQDAGSSSQRRRRAGCQSSRPASCYVDGRQPRLPLRPTTAPDLASRAASCRR